MPSRFRTSFTQTEGHEPARIVQGRIMNVNLVKWTVDVAAQFDRKKYFNIQVGSPYLHHSNGEGIYVVPEIGCTAVVCIPSDSTPPFVLAFVMAHEAINSATPDAPQGTSSHSQPVPNATDSSFAGGRPTAQLGDIWLRTRDNNFIILHRGGVLQIGATELAQRIYMPLNNQIIDMSENYAHHNAGGAITWGLQDGPSLSTYPCQYQHTLRVFADDQYADIRISEGNVYTPMGDPDGGAAASAAGLGTPIIYEVAVSPKGFIADSGELADPQGTVANSVLRFAFDRASNTLLRISGNVSMSFGGTLTVAVTGNVTMSTQGSASLTAVSGITADGGQFVALKGSVIRLKEGAIPVSRIGDQVLTPLVSAPCMILFATPPVPNVPAAATITGAPLIGMITQGNPAVLA